MIDGIAKLTSREDLTDDEAEAAMRTMMSGKATEADMAAFLIALKMKGESASEISSFAKVMREYALKVRPKVKGTLLDVCGTGGDSSGTFNISTAAMFAVAGCGVAVAKHGNRSITSKSGSADVLEALGARIDLSPARIESCIEEVGVGFMFAPNHHPAMKHVMPVRRQLGVRTVFNILGPLTNPAGAQTQLMGVYDANLTETIANVFMKLGLRSALVVHGEPGLDELSTIGLNKISQLSGGRVHTFYLDPSTLGFKGGVLSDLAGGSAAENAKTIRAILSGGIRDARRDMVVFNAAGGLMAAGAYDNIRAAIGVASQSIDSGAALAKMEEFIAYTRREYGVPG